MSRICGIELLNLMNHRITQLLILFVFFILSCGAPPPPVKVHSMAGLWQTTEGPLLYEKWYISPDSNLKGISFSINQGDTLIFEEMRIAIVEGKWHFYARVPNENDSDETAFALTEQEKSSWVFENADNAYPNRIIYSLISDSSLYARIENSRGNQQKEFHFKRINNALQPTDIP